MEKEQRAVVGAFIYSEGKVLIAKRSSMAKIFPGTYELPGGKVEFGESPEQALKREILEELGVRIYVKQPFYAFSYLAHEGRRHHVEITFLCELAESPDNIRLTEHEDMQWVTREQLDDFRMSAEVRKAAEAGFGFTAFPANRPL